MDAPDKDVSEALSLSSWAETAASVVHSDSHAGSSSLSRGPRGH
jgi:hypothetical protein